MVPLIHKFACGEAQHLCLAQLPVLEIGNFFYHCGGRGKAGVMNEPLSFVEVGLPSSGVGLKFRAHEAAGPVCADPNYNFKSALRVASNGILTHTITSKRLAATGYFVILNYYESLRLCD